MSRAFSALESADRFRRTGSIERGPEETQALNEFKRQQAASRETQRRNGPMQTVMRLPGWDQWLDKVKETEDEAAFDGKSFSMAGGGGMGSSRRPSLDALDDFAARSRQPHGPVMGGGIDLGRSMDLENLRGARLRNRGADASLALAESEGMPYGTPEQRTALDLKRRGAIGDFDRAEGAKNFDQRVDQKFDEFFDPRTETMHEREDERANARVSHAAGEEGNTLLGRYQLDAGAEVSAAEIEARQRADAARMDAITKLLEIASAGQMPGPGNTASSRALTELDRLTGAGGGGQQAAAGGAAPKGERSLADVRQYARENGMTEQEAIELYKANGYAVR